MLKAAKSQLKHKPRSYSSSLIKKMKIVHFGNYLTPPSVTLIRRISSGPRIPNWTRFTWRTGALLSDVLIDIFTSQHVSAKGRCLLTSR